MPIEIKADLRPFEDLAAKAQDGTLNEMLTEHVLESVGNDGPGRGGYVPYRTGHLHDSATVTGKDEFSYTEHYAAYVYFGTSRQKAQPWFETAKAAKQAEWEQWIAERIAGK